VEVTSSSRATVVAFIMVAMAMVAMEVTIVATAMPQIVADLGGLQLYSWVFSSFVLTQTAMTVVSGKLADVHGRRPIMLAGLAIFVAGSIMAGAASTMPVMIAARLVQGAGAGAILPTTLTIIADLYPARERGRVQGWLASVWAVSALAGPMAGALIIQQASWSWIFWLNVPVGLLAGLGFVIFLRFDAPRVRASIDYAGAGLFTLAVTCLMVALTDTATASPGRLAASVGGLCLFSALFVLQERHAADPMVSFSLWRRRPVAAANGAAAVTGMALMGATTFLPMFVQGVLHRTPVVAGLTLTMVMVGWPAGATLAARLFPKIGLRPTLLAGGTLVPLGASVFALLAPDSSPFLAGAGSLVMGFGMGLVSVSSLILVQEIVEPGQRGSATASNLFARNLGSTLGAAVLGAVQASGLAWFAPSTGSVSTALSGGAGQAAGALQSSLHLTFEALFAIACFSLLFTLLVPSRAASAVTGLPGK